MFAVVILENQLFVCIFGHDHAKEKKLIITLDFLLG